MNTLMEQPIEEKIHTVRGVQVMLDRDLAVLYGVETKRINEAVKNNPLKFPEDFFFVLTDEEEIFLRSKISTLEIHGKGKHRKYPIKAFTEQGVYMLATILKSKTATDVTISIMRTFTRLKHFMVTHASIYERFERVEDRLNQHDKSFEKLFRALENNSLRPEQGIFFDGQIFDAYVFVSDLIKSAKSSIILIDNYIDESVLTLFTKNQNIDVTIYTHTISKRLRLDLQKYNTQYRPIQIKTLKTSHDRFLILDEQTIYHIGASLKDLGKRWFAFSHPSTLKFFG